MNKVIRDGRVGVLVASQPDAKWFTWHKVPELLFDPYIINKVENMPKDMSEALPIALDIEKYCDRTYGDRTYYGDAMYLSVEWIPFDWGFEVVEDEEGFERVVFKEYFL